MQTSIYDNIVEEIRRKFNTNIQERGKHSTGCQTDTVENQAYDSERKKQEAACQTDMKDSLLRESVIQGPPKEVMENADSAARVCGEKNEQREQEFWTV